MKPMKPMAPMAPPSSDWWPEGLDSPSASGSQNGWRYAYFSRQRRLALERDGVVTQYDTGDHAISGVSQDSEGGEHAPVFTSQHGPVRLDALRKI